MSELSETEQYSLLLTDKLIGLPAALSAEELAALEVHFSQEEIAELFLSVGLFHGMSKVLIALGLEPEDMPVTVVPTPGSS